MPAQPQNPMTASPPTTINRHKFPTPPPPVWPWTVKSDSRRPRVETPQSRPGISVILGSSVPTGGRFRMTLTIGDTAPDFTAETTEGTISFHDWLGDSWGVLFSHPR